MLWGWLPAYNAFVGIGVALGAVLVLGMAPRRLAGDGHAERVPNLLIWALLGGLLGAHAFTRLTGVTEGPWLPLRGFTFYGGLLCGLGAVIIGCKVLRLPVLSTMDLLAPPVALAHAIGRLGCFFSGCCFGQRSSGSWQDVGFERIPVQLIESGVCLAIFAALLWLSRREPSAPGSVACWYVLTYAVARFLLEYLRDDDRGGLHGVAASMGVSPSQAIALGTAVPAALYLVIAARRSARGEPPANSG